MDPQKTSAPQFQDQDSELPEQSGSEATTGAPPVDSSDTTLSDLGLEGSERPSDANGEPETTGADSASSPVMPDSEPEPSDASMPKEGKVIGDVPLSDASSEVSMSETDDSSPVISDVKADPLPLGTTKHRKKGLFVGLIAAATLLLISGGAAAAYYYVVNKPDNVLKQALANTLDPNKNKSMYFSGELTAKDKASSMKTEGTFEGQINNQTGALSLSGSMDLFLTKLGVEVRSDDGKTVYFKLDGLDGLGGLLGANGAESIGAFYAQMVASVNGQWLEINPSIAEQFGVASPIKQDKLTDADRSKIVNAYQKHMFLVVRQKLPDEAIMGAKSYHYMLGVDKDKLKAFVLALRAAKLKGFEAITDAQVSSFNSIVDRADFGKFQLGIWITKSNKMISQLSLNSTEGDTTTTLRFTVDSYNKPVNVEKPEGAKSLMEVITNFYTGLTGGSELMLPDFENGISL